jgi:hypothetical protein
MMNASDRSVRPATRQPRIRVFHAYQLMAALERLTPWTRRRMKRRIATAAIQAMIDLKQGLDITSHPFEGAGLSLVLSARWSDAQATLTIEVDLRPKGAPSITLIGVLPKPRASRRE